MRCKLLLLFFIHLIFAFIVFRLFLLFLFLFLFFSGNYYYTANDPTARYLDEVKLHAPSRKRIMTQEGISFPLPMISLGMDIWPYLSLRSIYSPRSPITFQYLSETTGQWHTYCYLKKNKCMKGGKKNFL